MLKILFITTGLTTGGAEVMLYNLLSKIDRSKLQPVILSLMDIGYFGELLSQLNIPVYALNLDREKLSLEKFQKLIGLIEREQPDIIQGWMYHGNIAAQIANFFSRKKTPIVWSIHHSIQDLKSEKLLTQAIIRAGAWTSKSIAKVAFVSEKSQQQHHQLGYPTHNTCTIPNGFDITTLKPSSTIREQFRSHMNLSPNSFLIGSVARYHPMKDHANLLNAARILLNKFSHVHFILVGPNVDEKNSTLTKQIAELNISNNVHLLGERRDVPQILPTLDILTSSSAFGEAFPLIIGEAMACEVPCVATDIGDTPFMIQDTGKVVPIKNPQALADAWQEMILMSPTERAALGKKARQRIIELFSLDAVVAKYETLYLQLASHNGQ